MAVLLCSLLNGGEAEVQQDFLVQGEIRRRYVDCQTDTHIIEIGMDRSSSLRDGVHQAVLYAELARSGGTTLRPMVIVIDTDGAEDAYQYEMRIVTEALGIPYGVCKKGFVQAWAVSSGLRVKDDFHDLPSKEIAARHCNLAGQFDPPDIPAGFALIGVDKPPLDATAPQPTALD